MAIVEIEAIPCRVPFRRDFVIGRGQVGTAGADGRHVFVRIRDDSGAVGWGEVRALPAWSYETVESIVAAIRHYLAPPLIGASSFELNRFQQEWNALLAPAVSNGQPFARAALEIALHDLQGQLAGVPIHALLGGRLRDEVPLTYALSIEPPEAMAEQARSYPECDCFKVKIAGDPEDDAARILAVSAARPDAVLWLDANQAYQPALVAPLMRLIRDVPRLFCLEQPVPSTDWLGLRTAREQSPFPTAVDEGCFSAADVARIALLRAADLVVLKVCKSGGLRECLRSAAVAQALGLGLLGSGLTETGVGLAASIHFFAAVPTLLPPELNGVQFLQSLWVEGLERAGTRVRVPTGPGLGVRVDEEAIRAHALEIRL